MVGTNLESGRKLQHRKFPLFLQTASSSSKPPSILRCFICFTILNPFINIHQGPIYIIIIPQPNNCVKSEDLVFREKKNIQRKILIENQSPASAYQQFHIPPLLLVERIFLYLMLVLSGKKKLITTSCVK